MQPRFDELLDRLIPLNKNNLKISTELRADYLTDAQIKKLKQLNVAEVEIGLQSTNPAALQAMGRKNRTRETITRTQKLLTAGISCKVDLIVGLPGDTLTQLKTSVDAVRDAGISDGVQVFRLSILSGTTFSETKAQLDIQVQEMPPYFLTSSPTFSETDIRDALDYAEEQLDVTSYDLPPYLLSCDFNPPEARMVQPADSNPAFVEFNSAIQPIHKLIFHTETLQIQTNFETIETPLQKLCETLVVQFIIDDVAQQSTEVQRILSWLAETHPHNNYQFILDFQCTPDIGLIQQAAREKPQGNQTYLHREAIGNLGEDLRLTSSLAVIVPLSFYQTDAYAALKEQCDVFLHMSRFNREFLHATYADNNFFFSGTAQSPAFGYLKSNHQLDEYTQFDTYQFERQKENHPPRIYQPYIRKL